MTLPNRQPDAPGRGRAFTLVELIVASVILALVVGATTIAVSQTVRSRDRATSALDAFSRAQVAVQRLAEDAGMALRDAELKYGKIAIVTGGPAGRTSQGLLLFTHQNRPVRTGEGAVESDEYEVQYRLEPGETVQRNAGSMYTLWRRSDPVIDDYPDAGGVASPIVDGLVSISLDAYDGSVWRTTWDSDADGYPHALRIIAVATDDAGKHTATARKVVSFDRTPAPKPDEESDTTDTTTTGTGTGTGTGGGG
jgi:prepilin-type N-terminal cleavage/methylation domain-containing protein